MNTFIYHLKHQLNRYGWHVKQTKIYKSFEGDEKVDRGGEGDFDYIYEVGRTDRRGLTVTYLTLSSDLSVSHYVYKEKLDEVEIWILKSIGRFLNFYLLEREKMKRIQKVCSKS